MRAVIKTLASKRWLQNGVWPWLAMAAVMAATAYQLHHQGRRWWCACGQPALWISEAQSSHTSQHLFDPYSFTHVLHGVALCGLLAWGLPRLPLAWRLWLVVCVESLWEVVENTAFLIERYRTATAALGYQGDSIANSLGDILSGAIGCLLAWRLGLWRSILLFLLTELVLLIWIRDDLLLSIIMLVYPVEAIKAWQMGQ